MIYANLYFLLVSGTYESCFFVLDKEELLTQTHSSSALKDIILVSDNCSVQCVSVKMQ